ncbi:MAG: hypothetical protein CMM76_03380, partial [Rhodospirillaceae bacterium]|nr:hypothetical protein [Rhodospirillaceae bacterium]
KHQGWARGSKIDYLTRKHLEEGLSKEQIKETSVIKNKIFKSEHSFNTMWNMFLRIKDDIRYITQ